MLTVIAKKKKDIASRESLSVAAARATAAETQAADSRPFDPIRDI
jgi:hypothetical protein